MTLLRVIDQTPDCSVTWRETPISLAEWEADHGRRAPEDLAFFLRLVERVDLFVSADYALYVHGIHDLRRANPVIIGEPCEDDRSYDWFLLANDGHRAYIVIDLAPERLGRCYDAYFETYGLVGDMPVVASSFTDFLVRGFENRGGHWWWLSPEFQPLGDAYDE